MKSLEEIEKLSLEDFEEILADENVTAPNGLKAKITARLLALECREQVKKARKRLCYAYAAAGLAAVLALTVLVFSPQNPEDTFDNPELARAELERTFAFISGKINKGLDLAQESVPIVERPFDMINNMNK